MEVDLFMLDSFYIFLLSPETFIHATNSSEIFCYTMPAARRKERREGGG
jgi:hypothetical protein